MNMLFSPNFNKLERSLDAASLQHKVIANNIANVDTPDFKRSEVRFDAILQKEMTNNVGAKLSAYRTNTKHLEFKGSPQKGLAVSSEEGTMINNSENNVDIDYEMALQAKTQMFYDAMIEQTNFEIRQMRTAIGGRV